MRSLLSAIAFFAITSSIACGAQDTLPSNSHPALPLHPLLDALKDDPGYFVDPYPVYVSENGTSHPDYHFFSGTTQKVLSCAGPLVSGCYDGASISVDTGPLAAQAAHVATSLGVYDNANVYRDRDGHWQMAFTVYVNNPSIQGVNGHWTVIAHAHPAMANGTKVPPNWIADTVLVGSLATAVRGNYDGKYFEDNSRLYLVYSKRLQKNPARDGIVAQPMETAEHVASAEPTVLLVPAEKDGGFNSELFHPDESLDQFKLVETGNVTKIGHTYVMAYSTGAYNRPAYKTAVAYSDTFLPSDGATYQKVFMVDTDGVWGEKGRLEVHYLLQGAKTNWPNYTGGQVLAPGVPSIVNDGRGHWSLFFAGYAVGDSPIKKGTDDFDGSHRRPFFIPVDVNIPQNSRVQGTPNKALTNWIVLAKP